MLSIRNHDKTEFEIMEITMPILMSVYITLYLFMKYLGNLNDKRNLFILNL